MYVDVCMYILQVSDRGLTAKYGGKTYDVLLEFDSGGDPPPLRDPPTKQPTNTLSATHNPPSSPPFTPFLSPDLEIERLMVGRFFSGRED
jgi:hypothetical protein